MLLITTTLLLFIIILCYINTLYDTFSSTIGLSLKLYALNITINGFPCFILYVERVTHY